MKMFSQFIENQLNFKASFKNKTLLMEILKSTTFHLENILKRNTIKIYVGFRTTKPRIR